MLKLTGNYLGEFMLKFLSLKTLIIVFMNASFPACDFLQSKMNLYRIRLKYMDINSV